MSISSKTNRQTQKETYDKTDRHPKSSACLRETCTDKPTESQIKDKFSISTNDCLPTSRSSISFCRDLAEMAPDFSETYVRGGVENHRIPSPLPVPALSTSNFLPQLPPLRSKYLLPISSTRLSPLAAFKAIIQKP